MIYTEYIIDDAEDVVIICMICILNCLIERIQVDKYQFFHKIHCTQIPEVFTSF